MKTRSHFRVINPAILNQPLAKSETGCGQYADAPVCADGSKDVGEDDDTIYRGCETNQTDCADNDGNSDDQCCFGSGSFGVGDNIDHAFCREQDADFGGFSWCFSSYDTHRPQSV